MSHNIQYIRWGRNLSPKSTKNGNTILSDVEDNQTKNKKVKMFHQLLNRNGDELEEQVVEQNFYKKRKSTKAGLKDDNHESPPKKLKLKGGRGRKRTPHPESAQVSEIESDDSDDDTEDTEEEMTETDSSISDHDGNLVKEQLVGKGRRRRNKKKKYEQKLKKKKGRKSRRGRKKGYKKKAGKKRGFAKKYKDKYVQDFFSHF